MPECEESSQHHRHSTRLPNYDYSQAGAYFITICLQNRECLFGEIINDEMILNHVGLMVSDIWYQIPNHYPGVEIDEFVVMPNHIHGIILAIFSNQIMAAQLLRACDTE